MREAVVADGGPADDAQGGIPGPAQAPVLDSVTGHDGIGDADMDAGAAHGTHDVAGHDETPRRVGGHADADAPAGFHVVSRDAPVMHVGARLY